MAWRQSEILRYRRRNFRSPLMAETLADLLREQGVNLKHHRPGSTHRINCPRCADKDHAFSVKIDADGQGFTGNCKHGSCPHKVGGKVRAERVAAYTPKEDYRRPVPVPADECVPSMACYLWFKKRGIGEDTVDLFGVYDKTHSFRVGDNFEKHEAIVFPYRYGPAVVNHKYRGFERKGLMGQDPKPMPTLFNIDAVDEIDPDVVIWVEGECDVMAIHEAGFPQVVSLKDGAPDKLKPEIDQEDKRFFALDTHRDVLSKVRKFILAGDMDVPGQVLREELARRLGRHKCYLVTWPDGCKDANDTLLKHGADGIRCCLDESEPYPIEGVTRVTRGMISNYLDLPPPAVLKCGIDAVDEILKFPAEGRVIIITGMPNSGKSKFVTNVMVAFMRKYRRKWGVFSPEHQPLQEFLVEVVQILVGKRRPDPRKHYGEVLSREESEQAEDFLADHLFCIGNPSNDDPPTLDWILETLQMLVLRYGITDAVIDPWNEVEAGRGSLSETDYVGKSLQRLRMFGLRYGVNVWMVAHPSKMQPKTPGSDEYKAPGPYDIAGSAHWYNKADIGITIHTPKDKTGLHLWKARFTRWGRKGSIAALEYDGETGRYSTPPVPGSQSAYKPTS